MSIHTVTNGQSQTFVFSPVSAGTSEEIDASGTSQVDITANGWYPTTVTINESIYTTITAAFHFNGVNFLNINAADGSSGITIAGSNDLGGAQATITAAIGGTGTLNVAHGGFLDLERPVGSDVTVQLNGSIGGDAELRLPEVDTAKFDGTVNFSDGQLILPFFYNAASYGLADGKLSIYDAANHTIGVVKFNDLSPEHAGLAVALDSSGEVRIYERGTIATLPGQELPQHVTPQPAAPIVAVLDVTTGQTVQDVSPFVTKPYVGPVQGLDAQFVDLSPDNLNVSASAPNLFIHTGAGNDAINVSGNGAGGKNVLDGGTGSNFLVGGTGSDTFFVDDRAATADIWSTVVNFHAGDAATVFGLSQANATLSWVDNQGAAGAQGLTLHASAAGKPTASVTLAGYSTSDLANGKISATYGVNLDSGSYLYIHAT